MSSDIDILPSITTVPTVADLLCELHKVLGALAGTTWAARAFGDEVPGRPQRMGKWINAGGDSYEFQQAPSSALLVALAVANLTKGVLYSGNYGLPVLIDPCSPERLLAWLLGALG